MQRTSFRFSFGSIRRLTPRSSAEITIGSAPRTGRTEPSSESSPNTVKSFSASGARMPRQHSVASAIGRSNAGPSFFVSAGARLTVSREAGKA